MRMIEPGLAWWLIAASTFWALAPSMSPTSMSHCTSSTPSARATASTPGLREPRGGRSRRTGWWVMAVIALDVSAISWPASTSESAVSWT